MCNNVEKDLAEKLKNTDTNVVYDALVKIRKEYVRFRDKMKKLRKYSVIELIIRFTEHPKFCSISLSIIADGCLELSFVNEVIKYNGIKSLMNIMKSFVSDDIQSKACRALGNMAKFEGGFKAVHHVKPISNIINFLSETSNANCKQVAVRTLMILGKSPKTRELIAQESGIVYIAKLLHSSDLNLQISSIRAIANFTQNCNLTFARQLSELDLLKVLVELCSHAENSVKNNALLSLKNLSSVEEIRSCLVKAGAVKLFTEILSTSESREMSQLAALALCRCLDHIHMWSSNGTDATVGLKALMVVLQNKKYQGIHLRVITSLIPLAYEYKVSAILLNLNVLQILIKILELHIEKHKCKSVAESSSKSNFLPDQSLYSSNIDKNIEIFSADHQLNISNCMNSMQAEKTDTEISISEDIPLYKHSPSEDISSPNIDTKSEHSLYNFSAITSDYSSDFYNPSVSLSPSSSPDIGYSSSSPCSGQWSPVLIGSENSLSYVTCNSPTMLMHSNSLTPERNTSCKLENEGAVESLILPTKSAHLSNYDEIDNINAITDICVPCTSKSDVLDKQLPKLQKKYNFLEISTVNTSCQIGRKKIKTENINNDDAFQNKSQNSNYLNISTSDSRSIPGEKQLAIQTIDYSVIFFIWHLSFHLGKKANSQMADKFCFSALIDYLCFIHNPCPKAETVLFSLIKNRYCFEKLIANGFISELEEKLSSNYSCIHRSCVKQLYRDFIIVGREEAESNYGIGTLCHILATSKKIEQLHAICAISKLVTEKSSLHKLLFQANGLSLLFSFLSDNNVSTRRRVMVSLCELYQTLTKEMKREECCFLGTCSLESSLRCSYKESFFNVTFLISNGVKILANREKICENSDYFSALLNGYFLETKAQLVTLSDISAENLVIIFHFLHGCGSSNCCPYIKRLPFSVLLELLSDCDRFLLLNIKAFVEDRLCHHLFPSTVSKIFRQSKIHNSSALTKKTLCFTLNMDVLKKDILYNTFEELMNLESNLNFFGEVENLIKNLF